MSISLVIWWQQYESLLLRTLENVCTGQIMFIQNDIQTVEMCDRKMLMFHPKLDVKCDPTDFQKILKHKWKSTKEHSNRVESWYFIPIQMLHELKFSLDYSLKPVSGCLISFYSFLLKHSLRRKNVHAFYTSNQKCSASQEIRLIFLWNYSK